MSVLKHIPVVPVCLAVFLVAGCASKKGAARKPGDAAREIFEADRAFARMSAERGPGAAFEYFTTPMSVQLPSSGPPVIGNRAIAEFMAGPPNSTLTWMPERADASAAGDAGWSWGTYESRTPQPGKPPVVTQGRYVSIWRRFNDGTWKVVLDIGNIAQ